MIIVHENNSKVIKAEMDLPEVYVGLGGNIGDSYFILRKALEKMVQLPGIQDLEVSRFYRTTPVSTIPQDLYVNAVCRFKTNLSIRQLFQNLQDIEKNLGKTIKLKEAPRVIDLDILFFGVEVCNDEDLQIPHPRWHERLFVLIPLADLTKTLLIPDVKHPKLVRLFDVSKYLQEFPNIHHETVIPITEDNT